MAPSLNSRAVKDASAVEKLVVRHLARPSSRSVWVGDVVAFSSPLGKPSDDSHVRLYVLYYGSTGTFAGSDGLGVWGLA